MCLILQSATRMVAQIRRDPDDQRYDHSDLSLAAMRAMRYGRVFMLRPAAAALVLLIAAPWSPAAQRQAPDPPALILYNGKVITVDGGFRVSEAFAIAGDRFQAVGHNADVRRLA